MEPPAVGFILTLNECFKALVYYNHIDIIQICVCVCLLTYYCNWPHFRCGKFMHFSCHGKRCTQYSVTWIQKIMTFAKI